MLRLALVALATLCFAAIGGEPIVAILNSDDDTDPELGPRFRCASKIASAWSIGAHETATHAVGASFGLICDGAAAAAADDENAVAVTEYAPVVIGHQDVREIELQDARSAAIREWLDLAPATTRAPAPLMPTAECDRPLTSDTAAGARSTDSVRCDAQDGDAAYHGSMWNGPWLICRAVGEWTLAAAATRARRQNNRAGFAVTSRTVLRCAQVGAHRLAIEMGPLLLPTTPDDTASFFPAAPTGDAQETVAANGEPTAAAAAAAAAVGGGTTDLLLDSVLDRVVSTGRRATSWLRDAIAAAGSPEGEHTAHGVRAAADTILSQMRSVMSESGLARMREEVDRIVGWVSRPSYRRNWSYSDPVTNQLAEVTRAVEGACIDTAFVGSVVGTIDGIFLLIHPPYQINARQYLASPNVPALYRDAARSLFARHSPASPAGSTISQSRHAVLLYLEMEKNGVHRQGIENDIAQLQPDDGDLPCYCRAFLQSALYRPPRQRW